MTEPDPANYPFWLAARSAGIVAFLLIAASVMLGLFLASNLSRRPGRPGLKRDLVTVHQQMTLTALALIAVHGLCLLGDKWLKPGVVGIAVPFTISYRPLWVGMGIIGGYLAATLGLTYYARRRIGARRWRQMHRDGPRLRARGDALAGLRDRRGKRLVHRPGRPHRAADPRDARTPLPALESVFAASEAPSGDWLGYSGAAVPGRPRLSAWDRTRDSLLAL